ncbi:MAG: hypothetical protein S0880_31910 [Actinomycetota bacterium]|nr:hypothetical protein [Actinomycetota bacterium]
MSDDTATRPPTWRGVPLGGPAVGRVLVGIGCGGLVAALLVTAIGVAVSRGIDDSAVRSIELSAEALETLDDTLEIADDVVSSTLESLESLESALRGLSSSFTETRTLADGLAELAAEDLPETIDALSGALPTLESTAASVDNVLGALGPFAPGYDPDVPLAESIGELRAGLEPLPDSLRDSAEDLRAASDALEGLDTDLAALADDVATLRTDLARTESVLADYDSTTAEARALAEEASDDIGRSATFATIAVVLAGLALAAGQVVPVWLGLRLLAGGDPVPPGTGALPDDASAGPPGHAPLGGHDDELPTAPPLRDE